MGPAGPLSPEQGDLVAVRVRLGWTPGQHRGTEIVSACIQVVTREVWWGWTHEERYWALCQVEAVLDRSPAGR